MILSSFNTQMQSLYIVDGEHEQTKTEKYSQPTLVLFT